MSPERDSQARHDWFVAANSAAEAVVGQRRLNGTHGPRRLAYAAIFTLYWRSMETSLGSLDWAIIVVYLLAVVGLGVAAGFLHRKGERGGEGGHYFLAGNTLSWPIIGLAMFAANISTVHLVSLAESAYKFSGMVYGNFEWMAGFTLILLSFFFAPLYLRSRVTTLPDFLERRFNRHCRDCADGRFARLRDRDSHRSGPVYGGACCAASSGLEPERRSSAWTP